MVLRFFPPLVTGSVIAMIGLSLIGADVGLIAGDSQSNFAATIPVLKNGPPVFQNGTVVTQLNPNSGQISHIVLAALVILTIIIISRLFTGFIAQTALLISIVGRQHHRLAHGPPQVSRRAVIEVVWHRHAFPFRASAVQGGGDHLDVHRHSRRLHRVDRGHARRRRDDRSGAQPERLGSRPGDRRVLGSAGVVHELLSGHRLRGELSA
jgi:hypothetical protein